MKLLRHLSRLFETSQEPLGYVAAMRKLALAREPVCKPPRPTQPVAKDRVVVELERIERL